jgi:hypothetical protein
MGGKKKWPFYIKSILGAQFASIKKTQAQIDICNYMGCITDISYEGKKDMSQKCRHTYMRLVTKIKLFPSLVFHCF